MKLQSDLLVSFEDICGLMLSLCPSTCSIVIVSSQLNIRGILEQTLNWFQRNTVILSTMVVSMIIFFGVMLLGDNVVD
jgi:hypothetical protein